MSKVQLYPALIKKLDNLKNVEISAQRRKILQPLIDFIQIKKNAGTAINLNFICTHNSRRSQLGQIWAQAISEYYNIETHCFSGGTEETAFFINAIAVLNRAGFKISSRAGNNPHLEVYFAENRDPLICYSKVYDAPANPSENFAAVMTCSHADENCPFIPGSDARIALDYKDPKQFDDTEIADKKYDERSDQIASEMIYVFKSID